MTIDRAPTWGQRRAALRALDLRREALGINLWQIEIHVGIPVELVRRMLHGHYPTTGVALLPVRVASFLAERGLEVPAELITVEDGCEWDPEGDRPARYDDDHNRTTRADLIVGANGKWRLCSGCAALPRFRRYRKRKPIGPKR